MICAGSCWSLLFPIFPSCILLPPFACSLSLLVVFTYFSLLLYYHYYLSLLHYCCFVLPTTGITVGRMLQSFKSWLVYKHILYSIRRLPVALISKSICIYRSPCLFSLYCSSWFPSCSGFDAHWHNFLYKQTGTYSSPIYHDDSMILPRHFSQCYIYKSMG